MNFKDITRDDVIRAINYFEETQPIYRKPRNTFLKYNGKLYPGKLIRKLSYELKNNITLTSDDLGGGRETARFFEKLGFKMDYKPTHVNTHPKREKKSKKEDLTIALYNQSDQYKNSESFEAMKEVVKSNDIDLLVLPEFGYFPIIEEFNNTDLFNSKERNKLIETTLNLSQEINSAIIINHGNHDFIVSIYANIEADNNDNIRFHFKHAYTGNSYFDLTGKEDFYNDQYKPALLKGWKIGFSICFDMLLPVLDTIKKENDAEIILNSTGGNVVRSKWINNMRARAVENGLFYLTTMGGEGTPNKTVISGSTPEGFEIESEEIGNETSGPIKKFIIKEKGTKTHPFSDQINPNLNKHPDFNFNLKDLDNLDSSYIKIDNDIYLKKDTKFNIVFVLVNNEEIFKPDKILKKMFSYQLDKIPNKKFMLVNKWDFFDENYYKEKLLPVLRTRATENFCAVLFVSPGLNQGFQATKTKTSQIIPINDFQIDLDLSRMGGPETFWNHHGKNGKKWLKSFKENLDKII